MELIDLLKEGLGVSSVSLKSSTFSNSCISDGKSYHTSIGDVFVKTNKDSKAVVMFNGEFRSLELIMNTGIVKVPNPMKVLELPDGNGYAFVMEYLDLKPLHSFQAKLGEQLASLHLHNQNQEKLIKTTEGTVGGSLQSDDVVRQFGFDTTTCCGFLPMDNTWHSNWPEFFARQRIQLQVDLLMEKHTDRTVLELWSELQLKLSHFFKDIEIFPALLHGDLWSGNSGEVADGPAIFDPGAFYGHDEFDLAIAMMFGGFNSSFFSTYHSHIPKRTGFQQRNTLYQLFHYLNHWNHFGSSYRDQTISIFKKLLKMY